MKITRLKRKRHVSYADDTVSERPGMPVAISEEYEAFKLRIRKINTESNFGEANFLIRLRTNNLRYILVYCFLNEDQSIASVSFWVNNSVTLPPGETVTAGDLVEEEKATLLVLDFCETYLKKKYAGSEA